MAYGEHAPRDRTVAQDLEGIFHATVGPDGLPRPQRTPADARPVTPAPRRRAPSAGVLGVLGALVLSAVALVAMAAREALQRTPAYRPAEQSVAVAPQPMPHPRTAPQSPLPRRDQPIASTSLAADATVLAREAVAPASRPAGAAPPATSRQGRPRPAAARASGRAAVAVARRPPRRACAGLSRAAEARCLYPQVLAADAQLRRAFARASRQGVSRSTLVAYRREWAGLRRRATSDPRRVISGYGQIAQELNRKAGRARTRG